MSEKPQVDLTRERILDVAEALFAEKGYRTVTVREITSEAQCNLAAVNYHFGNKYSLYLDVFRWRWVPRTKRVREAFGESLSRQPAVSPSAIVRSLALAFLHGPLTDEELVRHFQLFVRELARPTDALGYVAEEVMRPFFAELTERLHAVLPGEPEPGQLLLNVISVFAMVVHFSFAREAVSRFTGRAYDDSFKALLVDHITQFALRGLAGEDREAKR